MGDTSLVGERGEFKRFPKLPLELRNMIWKEAAIVPQFVMIGMIEVAPWLKAVTFFTKPPAILHACSESRLAALPEFEIAFTKNAHEGDGMYFNFSRDALSFKGFDAINDFFFDGHLYPQVRLFYQPGRRLFALSFEELTTAKRLGARSLRILGQPSHVILVREQGSDLGLDETNAGWIKEFWTRTNGHVRNGEVYPCSEVSALTYGRWRQDWRNLVYNEKPTTAPF
ncbi:hypothetical protein ONS96_013126 [Cadophora gregata f. sp. sojae]|nr:hypothetical protein ONS96_013126 [Cadophora gregata f. sp. sojae]